MSKAAVKHLKSSEWSTQHGVAFTLEAFVKAQVHPLVVIKFGAPWCGPCRDIAPTYEALAAQGGQHIGCFEVDVEESEDIAVAAGVTALPTFVFYASAKLGNGALTVIDKLEGPTAQHLQQKFMKGYEIVTSVLAAKNPPAAAAAVTPLNAPPVVAVPPQHQPQQQQVATPQAPPQPLKPNDVVKRELIEIRNSLVQAIQRTERLFQSLQ